MKKRGLLWHVDDIHINASPDFHFFPNHEELKLASNVPSPRKFHAIFQFRFSSWKRDFHTAYPDLIMRIATKTANALQQNNAVHLASFVVLAARGCKGRLMPSFAADPATEMRLIEQKPPVTGAISHTQVQDLAVRARAAAQATLNITDQLLYAQMHGCRPLLVSMDINGISSNSLRLSEFVWKYHEQYGRLHIAIRIRLSEKHSDLRREFLDTLCPFPDSEQLFGFYTSNDFVAHHYD